MRVLLLEDDPDIGNSVKRWLTDIGYAVDMAVTLDEAEERAVVNEYDVWVFDRTVPGGDAVELVAERRALSDHTPALLLTARDTIGDRVEGLNAGADDYLIKPFAMEELCARVNALTRRGQTTVEPALVLGDVEVDPQKATATRAGNDLGLTVKELAVLRYLIVQALRDPGRVVSRTELVEHCWDEFAEPMSNVVDVKVGQLRKKLGEPPIVRTVRGVGYVASAES